MKQWTMNFIALVLVATATSAEPSAHSESAKYQHDRDAILAMAGGYQVTFRFDETLTLVEDAKPSKRKVSRAHELVFVLEDSPERISMQHLLVVDRGEDERHVVKHWRQDWVYEPREMFEFRGHGTWERVDISRKDRAGAWKQTVYQVDDSPRYSGIGTWVHTDGHSYWESNKTWRPLPRREHSQRDDYDVLVGMNRHSTTPEGWAHEQDNYKLALREDGERILARETGCNTYRRDDDYDFDIALEYWDNTKAFWSAVNEHWDMLKAKRDTLRIADLIDDQRFYHHVMPIAEKFVSHEIESVDLAMAEFENALADYLDTVETD